MLLPDSMELRICVPFNSRSTAWASFDGRGRVELKRRSIDLVCFPSFDAVFQRETISKSLHPNTHFRQSALTNNRRTGSMPFHERSSGTSENDRNHLSSLKSPPSQRSTASGAMSLAPQRPTYQKNLWKTKRRTKFQTKTTRRRRRTSLTLTIHLPKQPKPLFRTCCRLLQRPLDSKRPMN